MNAAAHFYEAVFFNHDTAPTPRAGDFALHPGDPVQSTSMQRVMFLALFASVLGMSEASAQPMQMSSGYYPAPAYRPAPDLGGGFIEFLFGDHGRGQRYEQAPIDQPVVMAPVQQQPLLQQPGMNEP